MVQQQPYVSTFRTPVAAWIAALLLVLLLQSPAQAQRRARYDKQNLKNSPALLETVSEVTAPVSQSTIRVLVENKPVALGAVVREDGYILTKASELKEGFEVELADGTRLAGTIVGVIKEHDLAAVKIEATSLVPLRFSAAAVNSAGAGQWLASPGVGSQRALALGNLSIQGLRRIPSNGSLLGVQLAPAVAGIPVHAVDPNGAAERAGLQPGDLILTVNRRRVGSMRDLVRSLRNGPPDAAYELIISRAGRSMELSMRLRNGQAGVTLASEAIGVPVASVHPGSGAAQAGILAGDVILSLENREVRDQVELIKLIQTYKPGDEVSVRVLRGGDEHVMAARLGYHTGRSIRGEFQNNLGTTLSARAVDFPAVLQHDSVLHANQMGGPLVDLNGQVLGLNIARAGRVETYALPAQVIEAAIPQLLSGRLPTATAPAASEGGEPPIPPDMPIDEE